MTVDLTADAAADATAAELSKLSAARPVAWSSEAKRLGGLKSWLVRGLWLYMFAKVLGVLLVGTQFFTPYDLSTWDPESTGIEPGFLAVTLLTLLYAALLIPGLLFCVVLVCRFVYRATRNLERANARGLKISAGWAVGWYFIPFANLAMPFQSMKEIWISSHDPEHASAHEPSTLGWWWGGWVVGNVLSGVSNSIGRAAQGDPSGVKFGYAVDALSSVPMIISCLMLMSLVRQISDAQDRQFDVAAF